jgi:hypothetical protein
VIRLSVGHLAAAAGGGEIDADEHGGDGDEEDYGHI